jgi:hypothetical protein
VGILEVVIRSDSTLSSISMSVGVSMLKDHIAADERVGGSGASKADRSAGSTIVDIGVKVAETTTERENRRFMRQPRCKGFQVVELRGFEPLTPCMPCIIGGSY